MKKIFVALAVAAGLLVSSPALAAGGAHRKVSHKTKVQKGGAGHAGAHGKHPSGKRAR